MPSTRPKFIVELHHQSGASFRRLDDALRFAAGYQNSIIVVRDGKGGTRSLDSYLRAERLKQQGEG